jgi:Protein of unknown function (DUF2889)
MISFQRSQLVGAEFIDDQTIRFNGIQEDHIYGMEVSLEVRIDDGRILKINGLMKRYTNFVCPQAVPVLQAAVGLSLREEGWDKQVMREIGRKGCEHFAEIIIECGRCLDQAVRARDLAKALDRDPGLNQQEYLDNWLPGM